MVPRDYTVCIENIHGAGPQYVFFLICVCTYSVKSKITLLAPDDPICLNECNL